MIWIYMAAIVTTFGLAVWVLETNNKKITRIIEQINKIIKGE